MDVLLSRKDTMKLLILCQLLNRLNQREIARRLNLTPQAISEYFKDLMAEEFISSGRDGYEITDKGLYWLIKNLFNLHVFTEELLKKLYSTSLVAIATESLKKGDNVFYWFRNGLIYCKKVEKNSNAIALMDADRDEEVLIKPFVFKPPKKGRALIVEVPDVIHGGSRTLDLSKLKDLKGLPVALGIEALIVCKKLGINPIFFGAKEACIESVHHGCDVIVFCTRSLMSDLIRRLIEEEIEFEILRAYHDKNRS